MQNELIDRWQCHLLFRVIFAGHVTSAFPCQQIAKVDASAFLDSTVCSVTWGS